jgi:hypothetical protein
MSSRSYAASEACRGQLLAEESNRPVALMNDAPHADPQRVTLDAEWLVEVRQLDHQRGCQGLLECSKCSFRLGAPLKTIIV